MRMGPHLVIQSTLVGSLLLSVFGFLIVPGGLDPYLTFSPLIQNTVVHAAAPEVGEAEQEGWAEVEEHVSAGCAVSPEFPDKILQWCGLITHYAQQNGLSPNLTAALILQESGGDPQAYSHSGAVGLMQIMPRDGLAAAFQCINGPCFASRPTIAELEDAEYNLQYGTRMLAGLISRYGSIRAALKAYGPMDVGFSYADKVLAHWQRFGNGE